MTKAEFIQAVDASNPLKVIAGDTGRMPRERDLARIMWIATGLLEKGEYKSAKDILKISLQELED